MFLIRVGGDERHHQQRVLAEEPFVAAARAIDGLLHGGHQRLAQRVPAAVPDRGDAREGRLQVALPLHEVAAAAVDRARLVRLTADTRGEHLAGPPGPVALGHEVQILARIVWSGAARFTLVVGVVPVAA
jgi:hypothetical protein